MISKLLRNLKEHKSAYSRSIVVLEMVEGKVPEMLFFERDLRTNKKGKHNSIHLPVHQKQNKGTDSSEIGVFSLRESRHKSAPACYAHLLVGSLRCMQVATGKQSCNTSQPALP